MTVYGVHVTSVQSTASSIPVPVMTGVRRADRAGLLESLHGFLLGQGSEPTASADMLEEHDSLLLPDILLDRLPGGFTDRGLARSPDDDEVGSAGTIQFLDRAIQDSQLDAMFHADRFPERREGLGFCLPVSSMQAPDDRGIPGAAWRLVWQRTGIETRAGAVHARGPCMDVRERTKRRVGTTPGNLQVRGEISAGHEDDALAYAVAQGEQLRPPAIDLQWFLEGPVISGQCAPIVHGVEQGTEVLHRSRECLGRTLVDREDESTTVDVPPQGVHFFNPWWPRRTFTGFECALGSPLYVGSCAA